MSTVGLPEEIGRLGAAAPQVGIAISLHAGDDETRGRFMPIGRRHRMPEIFAALENLPSSNRRITIEYVLLGGENDRPQDARELLRQLRRLSASGIRPHVNLIAFNPWEDPAPGPPHRPGTEEDAERFLAKRLGGGIRRHPPPQPRPGCPGGVWTVGCDAGLSRPSAVSSLSSAAAQNDAVTFSDTMRGAPRKAPWPLMVAR